MLRYRIVASLLSGRPFLLPELSQEDLCFLNIISKLCFCDVDKEFVPGSVFGGCVDMDVPLTRGLGFYLEPIAILSVFAKCPCEITLRGVTAHPLDPTIDSIRTVLLKFLKFHSGTEYNCTINSRGSAPLGGGSISISIQPYMKFVKIPSTCGQVCKIRGVATCTRTSGALVTRIINACRPVLTEFIPDVYIFSDAHPKGKCPGFSISLVAMSTTGAMHAAEIVADKIKVPDELGSECAKLLLKKIQVGASVDPICQFSALILATVATDTVSKFTVLPTIALKEYLNIILEFFNVKFNVKQDTHLLNLTGIGIGYFNINKKIY